MAGLMERIGSATERNSRVPTHVLASSGVKTYKDNDAGDGFEVNPYTSACCSVKKEQATAT
jgi:hypothetical protein